MADPVVPTLCLLNGPKTGALGFIFQDGEDFLFYFLHDQKESFPCCFYLGFEGVVEIQNSLLGLFYVFLTIE